MEPLGKGRDRSVRTPELLQNAASGGVRERAERGIEVVLEILNHVVQYTTWRDGMQWGAELHRPWKLNCSLAFTPIMLLFEFFRPQQHTDCRTDRAGI